MNNGSTSGMTALLSQIVQTVCVTTNWRLKWQIDLGREVTLVDSDSNPSSWSLMSIVHVPEVRNRQLFFSECGMGSHYHQTTTSSFVLHTHMLNAHKTMKRWSSSHASLLKMASTRRFVLTPRLAVSAFWVLTVKQWRQTVVLGPVHLVVELQHGSTRI